MKKKSAAIVLPLCMVLGLTACGDSAEKKTDIGNTGTAGRTETGTDGAAGTQAPDETQASDSKPSSDGTQAQAETDAPDYAYRFLQADLTLKNDLSYLVYEKSMIEDIILIDKAGNNFYIGSNLFEYKKDFREEPFYQDIVRANGKCHIFAEGIESLYKEGTEEYFAIAKVIRSRENMENIGAVIVTIPLERLARTFENYLETETQRCLILSDQEVLLDSSAAAGDDENSVDRWLSYSNRNRVTYGGEDYLINGKTSSGTGLRMIWMSPYRLMREKTYPLIFFIGIIAGRLSSAAPPQPSGFRPLFQNLSCG